MIDERHKLKITRAIPLREGIVFKTKEWIYTIIGDNRERNFECYAISKIRKDFTNAGLQPFGNAKTLAPYVNEIIKEYNATLESIPREPKHLNSTEILKFKEEVPLEVGMKFSAKDPDGGVITYMFCCISETKYSLIVIDHSENSNYEGIGYKITSPLTIQGAENYLQELLDKGTIELIIEE